MINLLHAIDFSGPGGGETICARLATGLDPKKFCSRAVVPDKGWIFAELQKQGLTSLVIPMKGTRNRAYLFHLVRIIRQNRIDLVQSHFLGSNTYCSLAGLICGVPVVSTFHGMVDCPPEDRLLRYKAALINTGSRRIVFVSGRLKEDLGQRCHFKKSKSIVIHNGIDLPVSPPPNQGRFRQELQLDRDDILIGSVGNLHPAKGYDILMAAAAQVVRQDRRYRFLIMGQTDGRLHGQLCHLRSELGLDHHVHFLGFHNDVSGFLREIDLFLLTSRSEGFSLALIEAMANGVPAIATRCGGPEEIIEPGLNGWLVPVNDADAIAAAIFTLGRDKAEREQLVAGARATVRSRFSRQAMLKSYEALYREITGHQQPAET